MTIIHRGPKQWLKDERQLDDKRPDHPAREFGHEPIVKGTFDPLTARESDEEAIRRLVSKVSSKGLGSFATVTVKQHTVKVELIGIKRGENVYRWTIREKGRVLNAGVLP